MTGHPTITGDLTLDGAQFTNYGDPTWQMGNPDGPHSPEQHYPTMRLEEIKALQIPTAERAMLFLWAVNSMLPQALEVLEAWGLAHPVMAFEFHLARGPGERVRGPHA